jgi:hypothetical protein
MVGALDKSGSGVRGVTFAGVLSFFFSTGGVLFREALGIKRKGFPQLMHVLLEAKFSL